MPNCHHALGFSVFAAFGLLLLLIMQPERQQTLRINVNAKAKTFHFKFKAITILPSTSKLFPFPIKLNLKLKLCPSLLQSKKSEPHFPIPRRGKSWKSKFVRILGKFRPRTSKNKATASDETSNLGHPDAHFLSTRLRHFPFEVLFHENVLTQNCALFFFFFYNLGALLSCFLLLLLQGIIWLDGLEMRVDKRFCQIDLSTCNCILWGRTVNQSLLLPLFCTNFYLQ